MITNEEGLFDSFKVGEKWKVIKQISARKPYYEVRHTGENKDNRGRISLLTAKYLGALYFAQRENDEHWISINDIAYRVLGRHENPLTPRHDQHLQNLRNSFCGALISKPSNETPDQRKWYRFKDKIIREPDPSRSESNSSSTKAEEGAPTLNKFFTNNHNINIKQTIIKVSSGFVAVLITVATIIPLYTFVIDKVKSDKLRPKDIDSTYPGKSAVTYDLSVRYLTGSDDKEYVLDNGQVLHSGDQLRLSLKPHKATYLYIFYLDSSNKAHMLFPPSHRNNIPRHYQNPIDSESTIHLPSDKTAYRLDDNIGYESLTIIAIDQELTQFKYFETMGITSINSESPGTLTELNRGTLEQALLDVRQEFVKTCPTCIKTINIIHQ